MKTPLLILLISLMLLCSFSVRATNDESQSMAAQSAHKNSVTDNVSSGIPYKKDTDPYASILGSFIFVIGALVGCFFLLSKHKSKLSRLGFLPAEQGKHLTILDRQKLHADNVVYVILVDGKKYLLVVSRTSNSINEINT